MITSRTLTRFSSIVVGFGPLPILLAFILVYVYVKEMCWQRSELLLMLLFPRSDHLEFAGNSNLGFI